METKHYPLNKIDIGIMKSISTDARIKLSDIAQRLQGDSRFIE
jgi:hypothetical protein